MSTANDRFDGRVALITGGAGGFGAAAARRLASLGASVVVADVADGGERVAEETGGVFVRCDVREPGDSQAAVSAAVERFGGLDIAFLNAGVATGCGVGDDFDLERYRRAMAVNVDGVVFGMHAALPALRARGGGDIVVTASLAGLTAVPFDPIYGANKHAVVGLVRAVGPMFAGDGIRINAVCPGFADTPILGAWREHLAASEVPLLQADDVADALVAVLASGGTGECWFVQPGRPPGPFQFRGVPGPRPVQAGEGAPAPASSGPS